MAIVTVDIDLSEFETDELIEELKLRGEYEKYESNKINGLIKQLRELHCPDEILSQLNEWACSPEPTPEKLQTWLEL